MGRLTDLLRGRAPTTGIGTGFDLVEQFDRLVELLARRNLRWMWDEMKANAALASSAIPDGAYPRWPPDGPAAVREMAGLPGASLALTRLAAYIASCPPDVSVRVHLVGHNAGSVFPTGILDRLRDASVPVSTLTYLAAAIRTDDWVRRVPPHLRSGHVGGFASFGLTPDRELDDVTGAGGTTFYQKSLLYLVSRALERSADAGEVLLAGMARFVTTPVEGTSPADAVAEVGGGVVRAPSVTPARSRTDARSHGAFDADGRTMTSVMMGVLGREAPTTAAASGRTRLSPARSHRTGPRARRLRMHPCRSRSPPTSNLPARCR